MARSFSAASDQRCTATWTATSMPFTIAGWYNRSSDGALTTLWSMFSNTTGTANRHAIQATSAEEIQARSQDASAIVESTVSSAPAPGANGHFAGVFASSTSRTAYVDGVAGSTNTTSRAPGSLAGIAFGAIYNDATNVFSGPFDGTIWEAAFWNVALTASEIAALAKGYKPTLIRPASLVSYWPLLRSDTDRWRNKTDVSPVNSPTFGAHGRMIFPGDG